MCLMDIIAVTLYSSMYTAFNAKEKSQFAIKPFQSVTAAFEYIRNDLTSTMNPDGILAGVFVGESNPFSGNRKADTLSFFTGSYQPGEDEIASNVINVAYEMDEDVYRDRIVLKRQVITNLLSPTAVEPEEEIICSTLSGFQLQYYDGSAWVDEWDSSVEDSQLPWAVRVTLAVHEPESPRSSRDGYRYFTRVFMLPSANQEMTTSEDSETAEAAGGRNG
jgi:hypothetical protein